MRTFIRIITNSVIRFRRIGTNARGRVTNAGDMTLILCRTHGAVAPGTSAAFALIRLRAGIGIITRGVIRFGRIGTIARGRVTNAGDMTLILCRAHHSVASCTYSNLTFVRLRTRIGIITRGVIRFGRIGTHARGRVTQAGIMALIQRRTHDWIAAVTGSVLASVRLSTKV